MKSKHRQFVEDYGITDPIPVIEKLESQDTASDLVFAKALEDCRERIARATQMEKANKILNKKEDK